MVGTGKATPGPRDCLTFTRMLGQIGHESALHINGMPTFQEHFHGRAILDQGNRFFAYILLIIELKAIVMMLKNVPHTISVK